MKGARGFFFAAAACALLGTNSASAAGTAASANAVDAAAGAPPVKLVFTTTYDTNVSASSSAIATLRGLAPVDEIYSPGLSLNYFHQTGIQSFFLTGQAGYDFYERDTILNRENIQASGGTALQALDCTTTVSGNYLRRQSSLDDLTLEDLSLVQTKNTLENISGILSASCNQSGLLIPSGSITRSLSSNTAVLRETSDYRNVVGQARSLYQNATLGEISLIGQYAETFFPHRFLVGPAIADGYTLYGGGVRFAHNFGARLALAGSISETSLRSDGGLGVNFDGLTYDSSLSYQATPRLQAEIGFSRQTNPATQLNATYMVDESYSASVDYILTARTKLKFVASQNEREFYGLALVQGVDLTRENLKSLSSTLSFDFTPRMSLNITANLDHRNADISEFSYSRARFGLTLSRAF